MLLFREQMGNYATEVRRVALQLVGAILESLGLNQVYLRNKFDCRTQVMATNFYQQSSEPNLEVGLNSHSDYGFITILLQSSQGLQVKDRDKGTWRSVPHLPGALHIQIGDHMEALSNGRHRSVIHRAMLNPETRRISIASIHDLSMDEKVAPAKEMVDEHNPKGHRETSFRDFLNYMSIEDCKKRKPYLEYLKILGK